MRFSSTIYKVGLLSCLCLASCVKETLPSSGLVTGDQVGSNPAAIDALAKGIPASMVKAGLISSYTSYHSNFGLPSIHLAMEAMTGDLVVAGEVGYYWHSHYGTAKNLGKTSAVIDIVWRSYYSWIKSSNDLIKLVKDKSENNKTYRKYMAQAFTYRAKCYLDLVRLYEFKENKYTQAANVLGLTVPYVDENTTEEDAKNNPRVPVAQMYELIMADLNKAEEIFEELNQPSSPYEPSLAAIYGMKARLYMEIASAEDSDEDYAQAATYARKAITQSGATVMTQEQWQSPATGFNSATAGGWIWALPQSSSEIKSLYNYTAHMTIETSWSYAKMTYPSINRIMYAKISPNDFRKYSWIDPDRDIYDYSLVTNELNGKDYLTDVLKDYSSIKFRPAGGQFDEYTLGGIVDIPLMRMEEMLFIEMEATAHKSLASARGLLNDFMSNRYINGAVYDCNRKTATLEDFIDEMIAQKRTEFWGEGIIMFDLKRLDLSPSPRGYVGTNAPNDYRLNTEGRAPFWNFVISLTEESNNTAIEGYNNPDPSNKVTIWTP